MIIAHVRPDTGETMGTMWAFKWMFRYLSRPAVFGIPDGHKYVQSFVDASYLKVGEELTMPGGPLIRRIK